MSRFTLMHKDVPVFDCDISGDGYVGSIVKPYEMSHAPLGTRNFNGYVDVSRFRQWWGRRPVPRTRDNLHDIETRLPGMVPAALLMVSHGCNLSDQYWMRPAGSSLSYRDVNFFDNGFGYDLGDIMLARINQGPAYALDLIGPDSGSGGNLPKAWRISGDGTRVLLKGSSVFRQEPYNEAIGSAICDSLGIDAVKYAVISDSYSVFSSCPCFVSSNEDFVPAYDIMEEAGGIISNPLGHVKAYIRFGEENGIPDLPRVVNQMACIDFLMRNTDRHWSNFGLIRDADTLAFKRVCPMFDFGNSLWHDTDRIDSVDGTSKVTGMRLYDDLRIGDANWFDATAARRTFGFAGIVRDVLLRSDMPRGRRESIAANAGWRTDVLLAHFGYQPESYGKERGSDELEY